MIERVSRYFSALTASRFARSVAILATGTVAAQAVFLLSSPVLTRLYSPADFGVFQVFLSILTSVSAAVCGGYDTATVLPVSEVDGKKVLGVAIHFTVAVALVGAVFLLAFEGQLLTVLKANELHGWVFLAPIALLLMGLVLSLNYFSIRLKHYDRVSKARIIQAILMATVSIGLGLTGAPFWGLIVGFMAGRMAASTYLLWRSRDHLDRKALRWDRRSRALAWRYREYPFFGAPGRLLNGLLAQMPVLFLSHFFPASVVGIYSLVVRVADAPLAVLSRSVSQVNVRKVVDLIHQGRSVRPYLLRLTLTLSAISLLPAIIVVAVAPDLFEWLFGTPWREAGIYLRILMPAIAVGFVVSTVSETLAATENNRLALTWQASAFVVTGLVFLIVGPNSYPVLLLSVYSATSIGLYLYYFFLIWLAAGHPRNR
jgi:O-antigen/teichoic acid export membrane protein